jgi:hypothetical protein
MSKEMGSGYNVGKLKKIVNMYCSNKQTAILLLFFFEKAIKIFDFFIIAYESL